MKWPSTLAKEASREALRQMVLEHMKPLVQAQMAHAMGIGHLYTRDKAGKFNKIEKQDEVDRLLSEGEEGADYWIFTKDPSVQAFTDLMNRALDKPKEQELEVKVTTPNQLSDRELLEKVSAIVGRFNSK